MHCATRRAVLRPRWLASASPTVRRKDCVGQSPPMNKGGPWAAKPKDRPKNAPASADQPPAGASSAASLKGTGRKRRYPLADASHYQPVNGRGRDALSIRCPFCKGIHLGRVRPGTEPGGPRRTPCGMVFVVVRRTYSPRAAA
jgi:hypothetical protein